MPSSTPEHTIDQFIAFFCDRIDLPRAGEAIPKVMHRGWFGDVLGGSAIVRDWLPADAEEVEAWGYGDLRRVWVCPQGRAIITYCEGDVDVAVSPTDEVYAADYAAAATFYATH